MNDQNYAVLTNIIGAVESGGQVYGKRNYRVYGEPYQTTPNEHTITLGWACNYGGNARKLMNLIHDKDPAAWDAIDTVGGIKMMLKKDWVKTRWKPTAAQKKIIIALIDSKAGHEAQDELFIEDMKKFVADCESDYPDAGIPAQMMYCEIRHLGGKSAVNRIFKRCKGDFSLDKILASLIADQKDTSSANQVGDQIFWTRHLKCRQWADTYAEQEDRVSKYKGVWVGSARVDERGKASGGQAGDQKQTSTPDKSGEVSIQEWYLHSKGWVVLRAKDPEAREKIARDMEFACDNPLIGYDQSENTTLYEVAKTVGFDCSRVRRKCETDCARLVRVCVLYAGIDAPDFYTGNLVEALKGTGAFDVYKDDEHCKKSSLILRGDILCTRTTGHVVVALSSGSVPDVPTGNVAAYQQFLNTYYPSQVRAACKELLKVDNSYGKLTRNASVAVWKHMANKYYGASLTVGNPNFFDYCKLVSARMTIESVTTHPTLSKIVQGVLAGLGYYKGEIDGVLGGQSVQAIIKFQTQKRLTANGALTPDTWYAMFN